MKDLHLVIVSQEAKLSDEAVQSVNVMTTEGEITILPGHIPLFTRLKEGILTYSQDNDQHSVVVSPGFLSVDIQGEITVMVDSGILARDVSEQKAQEAIDAAQETIQNSTDRRELLMAEASLRLAMLELKIARKSKKAAI